MNQALQTNLGDKRVESDTGNDLVDKYVKKHINLYETETLISVRNCLNGCFKIILTRKPPKRTALWDWENSL